MKGARIGAVSLGIALAVLCLFPAGSASAASAQAVLTTDLVPSHGVQATQGGLIGASVSFNSTLTAPEPILVFGTLVNAAGQTLSFQVLGTTIPANGSLGFFFGLPPTLTGTFKVIVFATTLTDIPLSVSTAVAVTS